MGGLPAGEDGAEEMQARAVQADEEDFLVRELVAGRAEVEDA